MKSSELHRKSLSNYWFSLCSVENPCFSLEAREKTPIFQEIEWEIYEFQWNHGEPLIFIQTRCEINGFVWKWMDHHFTRNSHRNQCFPWKSNQNQKMRKKNIRKSIIPNESHCKTICIHEGSPRKSLVVNWKQIVQTIYTNIHGQTPDCANTCALHAATGRMIHISILS